MAFSPDPDNLRRVVDEKNNQALESYLRNVPDDQRWFEFSISGVTFLVKTDLTISREDQKFVFRCDVDQVTRALRMGSDFSDAGYSPDAEEFRQRLLPSLRDAIICFQRRIIRAARDSDRWKIEVLFDG